MGTGGSDVDCNETIERLYNYLDGELTDERRVEIKRHLDDCPPCLGAFDFEAELRVVIANRCKDHVPEDAAHSGSSRRYRRGASAARRRALQLILRPG